jgi:fatty acid desaturase
MSHDEHAGRRPRLDPSLSGALHAPSAAHYLRIAQFIALYIVGAAGAIWLFAATGGAWWSWLVCAPLYLLAGASLHGVSLFTHEAVHGLLSRRPTWNRLLGALCAWPVLQTCSAYIVLHLKHHKHTGAPGDPDHFKNYTPRSPLVFAMHWGRLLLGYPAYISAIPVLGFIEGDWRDRRWIAVEVACLAGLIVAGVTLVRAGVVPWAWALHGWLLPMLFINTMVNIRGMSQHTLLEHERDVVRGTRTILTNRVTAWFMCNENYHLEHHLYPGVPWHRLPTLHAELEPALRAQGAPFIPSYAAFVADFVRASLWREDAGTVTLRALSDEPAEA